jgi:antitoxin component YwqK of YwqJK toxin-antitoxin module/peroxiredoxin
MRLLSVAAVLVVLCSCAGSPVVTVHHDGDGGSSSGRHVDGLRNGPWTEYYASGQKQAEGSYENDVQTGTWTYWFANGNKEMEGRFVDERRDGEWKSWHENGALRACGQFERGFEEGSWKFYDASGALEHEGMFELGRPVLRWTWFETDGSVRASGNYHHGVRVGEWTTTDAARNKTDVRYPLPTGCELSEERFADGSSEREGFVQDGIPSGRWISRHPGGALRLECTFENGAPNGRAHAWRADGTPLAAGNLKDGCMIGAWTFQRGSVPEEVEFKQARPRATFGGEWSPASIADQPGCVAVETWVAEMCSSRQPAPLRSAPAAIPAPELESDVSGIPARAQPWTEYESGALPALVRLYGRGGAHGARDAEDWSAPVLRGGKSKTDASVAAPEDLVGRALPLSRFTTADGSEIDLAAYAGKRNVLITILRGFGGQVCVYCAAQTKGLADYADKFAALETEVVVVYPGPKSGLAAFLEAYRRTFGSDEKLPYKLLYDADLALTRALHIEDNIAVPTSLLLDKQGVIRWSHVAKDYADRPSAQQILAQIALLPKYKR